MITQFKHNSYRFSPLAAVLIVILACISLPDAIRTKASVTSVPAPSVGMTVRKVWEGRDVDNCGKISPDGKYLSYVDWGTGDLAVYEIATGKKRRLTNKGSWKESDEFADFNRWSPDSRQIVYAWYNQNRPQSGELRVIDADGSAEPRILFSDESYQWISPCDWSKDGKLILTWPQKKDGSELAVISVADGSIRVLKEFAKGRFNNAIFSPEGDDIVYDDPNGDIIILSVKSGEERTLVKHQADYSVLGWGPDGTSLLFSSDRSGLPDIWAIQVIDGRAMGDPWVVKPGMGFDPPRGLGTTTAGLFYYSHSPRQTDVYVTEIDHTSGNVVSPPQEAINHFVGSNATPDYSPDGKYIAYVSKRVPFNIRTSAPVGNVLCIRSLETGEESTFRPSGLDVFGFPRWSPDGRSLMVVCIGGSNIRTENGEMVLYTINAETGKADLILKTQRPQQLYDHEWGPDEKSVVFVRGTMRQDNTGDPNMGIVKRDIAGGQETTLLSGTLKDIYTISRSPHGRWLAVLGKHKTRNLRVIPLAGGEPRVVYTFEQGDNRGIYHAWSADGKHILMPQLHDPQGNRTKWDLCRIAVEDGKPQNLGLGMPGFRSLSMHPDGRHIAFSSQAANYAPPTIWVMENFLPTTAVVELEPKPMTTVRKIESDWGTFASLSPDGRYLCDVDWDTENLAVLELATGKIRRLTDNSSDSPYYPLDSAISPDSSKVAYLWFNHDTKASSLHVVGLDGSDDRILCKGKYPMPRDWSADGEKILTIISEKDVQQMVWISASDGSIKSISSFDNEGLGYPGKFDISPDGRFIAYDRPQAENTSQRDVFLFDLIGDREISIVEHPSNDKLLGWSPDGRHILFTSYRTGIWDAWVQKLDNREPQGFPKMVKQDIGDIRPIGFTRYGSYYYAKERLLEDVFIARLDLENGVLLSEPMPVRQTGATGHHGFSPDGKYLAYCDRRPDKSQVVYIRTLATGRERTLAENLPYIRWLRWSLDGRSLLIDGARGEDSQGVIYKIDIETGQRTDLVQSETEVLIRPEMSPDGKTLYYVRNDPKTRTARLMTRDLEDGREKELLRIEPPARLNGSDLSPDGRQFILSILPSRTGPEGPVLKVLSTTGGQPEELIQFNISEKLRAVGVTWMPDSRNIIFWKWFQGFEDLELWRISADGGQPRRLWSNKSLGQMRVHPDGQRVAFYGRASTRGIWVMENFLPAAAVAESGK